MLSLVLEEEPSLLDYFGFGLSLNPLLINGLRLEMLSQLVFQDHAEILAERSIKEKIELAHDLENGHQRRQMIEGVKPLRPFFCPLRASRHDGMHGPNRWRDQRIFVVLRLDDRHDQKIDMTLVIVPSNALQLSSSTRFNYWPIMRA